MNESSQTNALNEESSSSASKQVLLGMDLPTLTSVVTGSGFPAFRARQLYHWLYKRAALGFDEMHNLAKEFRAWLNENCTLGFPEIVQVNEAEDGSKKVLLRLGDGNLVESVLMRERDWFTLCLSSQVGCALACRFCMTGYGGFRRQMTSAEIISQVLLTRRLVHGNEYPRNLVFMGMGEPMLNLGQVIPVIRILTDPDGAAIAARRVTVSTAGIAPGIERLAKEGLGVNIAISLNAPGDALRSKIMPVNRQYPIEVVLEACMGFPLKHRRRITFEYVLLAGVNDSEEHARRLAALLRGLPCKINLIPWNPDLRLPFRRPEEDTIQRFQQYLLDRCYTVSVRHSKGLDVNAACGQLAGHWESEQRTRDRAPVDETKAVPET